MVSSILRTVRQSAGVGFLTAMYFLPEIFQNSRNSPIVFLTASGIQMVHDAVCVLFVGLFWNTVKFRSVYYLLILNMMHCIVMMLFCYYKRCILTLMYNHILDLEVCVRYIPIWQRFHNWVYPVAEKVCGGFWEGNQYQFTYMWLNNHILQSFIVFLTNGYIFLTHPSLLMRERKE
jgi:hypothetical protein